MASITSPVLPLSKPDFPFRSSQRHKKTTASSTTSGGTRLRKYPILRRVSKLHPLSSNGLVVRSLSSNRLDEDCFSSQGTVSNSDPKIEVQSRMWNWRGYSIRYQYSGNSGPALVLIHGFGANRELWTGSSPFASDHWRKNIPVLAKSHRVYSIDLIGYGYSDKPNPRQLEDNYYTFETWATQLNEFCDDVVKDEAFFICNSIGGVVGLQAVVMAPQICKGIMLLNISLRMLHIKKQPWFGKPFIRLFQGLLRNTALGKYFFKIVATPESVRSILCQCYHDTSQVTEELVEKILNPGLEPGAADVFLEFICYSGGPLPEELLPQVKCPVLIAWGDKDPWEPLDLGRNFGNFDSVEDFVVLPNVGHCPQDEAPHLVNPLVESFVARHAAPSAIVSTAI